eukprot:g36004.t1
MCSTLIRKLGGFFIRRKLDIGADGRKDVLYRAVLRVYIGELLRQQQFMEIFVEGTRSRSGKPYMAMTGLLSIVVDSLYENTVTDVMIIPVGISYDRIIEGNYNSEQLEYIDAQRNRPLPAAVSLEEILLPNIISD